MPTLFNPKKKESSEEKSSGGALFKPNSTTKTETKTSSGGALFKPSGVTMPIEDTPYDTTSTDRSINNAKMRIQSAGGELDKDPRNWLEKKLNVTPDQNWLFDTLEVIGRPQQAFYGGVKALWKGEDRDAGAMAGLKGNQKLSGSDFIENTGIDNKYLKGGLGFGVDVASDPLNLIPVGAITKGVGAVSKPISSGFSKLADAVPAVQSVKDGLGSMFKYQYGWNKTLDGGADDTIKNAFNQTQNDVRYKSEEALKNVANQVREAGGYGTGSDVGRIMEKDIVTPHQGPKLPTSSDPKIIQAADNLMKSNDEIRDWANSAGVEIDELQGYMSHIWSAEERAFRKTKQGKKATMSGSSGMSPNDSILKKRQYEMSAEDANISVGREMFNPNAYFSSAIGQKRLIEYVGAKKFMDDVLTNPSFAMKKDDYVKKHGGISDDLVTIKPDQFKFFKVDMDNGKTIMGAASGAEYVVTKGAKQALERFNQVSSDEGIQTFLRGLDKAQGMWKRLALLSGGYHVRNAMGAMFNNYVGGMNPVELARYTSEGVADVTKALAGNETALYKEFRQQGLGSSSQMAVDLARAGDTPEKALEKTVKDMSKSKVRRGLEKANPFRVFQTSQEAGNAVDQANRMALYKWAKDKGMTPQQAADKVREVQFDYTRTTNTEREAFTRLAPFYRWSRNNIPFQIKSLVNDPAKYARVDSLYENAQEMAGIDEENIPEYMREGMYLPVSGDGKGSGSMLGMGLPAADLIKLSNPGKLGLDSLTPLLKTPIETIANRNFFYNNDIERFKGQEKKFQIPEQVYGMDVPGGGKSLGGVPVKAAHAIESFGGQPVRGLSKMLSQPTLQEKENEALKPSLGIRNMIKQFDINKSNYFQKRDELKKLMDYIDYLEQEQGQRPKTISQIKKGL